MPNAPQRAPQNRPWKLQILQIYYLGAPRVPRCSPRAPQDAKIDKTYKKQVFCIHILNQIRFGSGMAPCGRRMHKKTYLPGTQDPQESSKYSQEPPEAPQDPPEALQELRKCLQESPEGPQAIQKASNGNSNLLSQQPAINQPATGGRRQWAKPLIRRTPAGGARRAVSEF